MADSLEYISDCPISSIGFSPNPADVKLAVGSLIEAPSEENRLTVVAHDANTSSLQPIAQAPLQYPPTAVGFGPLRLTQNVAPGAVSAGPAARELLATSSDHLVIWDLSVDEHRRQASGNDSYIGRAPRQLSWRLMQRTALSKQDYSAPLTSFSWSDMEPAYIVTSSIDTTCTIWDIQRTTAITQLIAHDREVYDCDWSPQSRDSFASVGADGSVRLFDIRALEHSTILYESAPPQTSATTSPRTSSQQSAPTEPIPLLRLAFNPSDPNYLGVFAADSSELLLLDVRVPGTPIGELRGHRGAVNGLAWGHAQQGGNVLASCADDCQVIVWDTTAITSRSNETNTANAKQQNHQPPLQLPEPFLAWTAPSELNSIAWSLPTSTGNEYLALTHGRNLTCIRV